MANSLLIQADDICLIRLSTGNEVRPLPCPEIQELSRITSSPLIRFEETIGDFQSSAARLASEVTQTQRQTVLLTGDVLEGGITRAAFCLLVDGFRVFIVSDWCSTAEPQFRADFETRLRNCGAIIVSSRQVINEMAAQCQDSDLRFSLSQLI
ncbi:isochorismatase family protein [Hyphomonas sp.]|uniref:isochorismatase family protein n=1 Tax=Hyphomonas sp. TaxID=87 RepID=UPI0025BBAD1B|nr:isochorismatase family protein [Hyphomonas sp.]